ncbi:T9SS type A sorting domain-containing protein [Flavobacterium sp.]|uniref:T9SS type A sorting domain-containing protein n=1 Tax=Flavobacterium sp. TaxID=239 RepID=UPI0025C1582C|nr:T9SS type A sorting domain-containing protein [Flavobacterium sp.]
MKTHLFRMAGSNYIAALLFLLITYSGFGQAFTGTWALTNNNSVAVTGGVVTGTPMAIGSGINSPSYSSGAGVTTSSWSTDAGSLVTNEYYEYEIVPIPGNKLTITSLSFEHSVTNGTWAASAQYSLNGFATGGTSLGTFVSGSTVPTSQSYTGTITVLPTQTFSVRIYAWDSDGSNRSFRNRSVVISGTSCAGPIISTQPTTQTLCAGSSLNLSVTATNATSYQWKKGGSNISGATSSTYSIPTTVTGDAGSYTVDVINACHTVTSTAAVITVNPVLASSVNISSTATTICAGTNVTFTATPVNAGSPSYQWKLNGNNVGTNSTTYSNNALTNGAVITCVMSSSTPCRTGLPATSNAITMTVNPQLPASVTVLASVTTICAGTQVTFTATPVNGGSSPSYQWKVNGTNSGTNSATFQSSTLNNGDSVTVVMTSNASPCLTGSPATSAATVITVNQVPTPVILTPTSTTVCQNTIVPINATGGVSTSYPIMSENFNATLSFTAAGTSSTGSPFANRASTYSVAAVGDFASPDASKFMLANQGTLFSSGTANTTLTSASINTTGYNGLTLSYKHTYKKGSESGVSVQVSVNGGTWTNVKTYASSQGDDNAFVTDNVNLNSYINVADLKVRFNYVANIGLFSTAWWGIDDVSLSGSAPLLIWSPTTGLYTDAAATVAYTGTSAFKVFAKPTSTTTYTATSQSPFGCGTESADVTVNVNPLPTLASTSQAATICQNADATINLTGMLAGSTSTVSYTINGGGTQTATSVIADGSGNASFTVNLVLGNNGQTLAITNIQRTDLPFTCSFAPAANNTATLQVNAIVTYYADDDMDTYGDVNAPLVTCFAPPANYVLDSTDCNDDDATMHTTFSFYLDSDEDGFGVGSLTPVCAVDVNTPPVGYSSNNTDCNDADDTVNANFDFFVDTDLDGFGSTTIQSVCAVDAGSPPSGFSLNNTDCNDDVAAIHAEFDFYVDGDGDTYGTGSLISVCAVDANTPPAGYSLNATDCNDALASVHPNTPEVAFNGIDDDCDGTIDEGSQLFSQVLPSQCGTTLTVINALVGAVSFGAPVDGYRFKVINNTTLAEQTIDRSSPNFQLSQLPSYDYATTYTISVMLRRNGIWLNYYGPTCLVSTPAVLDNGGAASVTPSQCGITLPNISTLIATTSLQGVTGYRFRITNTTDLAAPNQVQILDRVTHWFSLTMLSTYVYGTTYTIEVAVKTNGVYSGFGAPCAVSTPAVPVITNPGTATTPTMLFYTTSMNRATSYRFELTYLDGGFTTTVVDRPSQYFNFNQIPGFVVGGNYAIRVAVMTSGVWSPFGESELITAPGFARSSIKDEVETPETAFRVVTYPNPYTESFSIDVDLPTDEKLNVKVYDMLGKLVETRDFESIDAEVQQFGKTLSAGVYNVIVTQGANVKTLRVIKR